MKPPKTPDSKLAVGFVSLGCAKNLVDSQVIAGSLLGAGCVLAPSAEEADVVIVNTCAFIEAAREESLEAINDVCRLKQEGRCRAVLVAGCLSQRYREELLESLPDVDAFIGVDELDRVGELVERIADGEQGVIEISAKSTRLFEPAAQPVILTGGPHAYLKVAEGCQHRCAFCAIPAIRGDYRSRSIASLVKEAGELLSYGFRELDVISQDVTWYGRDRDDGADLPALLRALSKLEGDFWIRLLYGYPASVTDELLAAMAESEQVCHYLDLPIQHSHADVLRAMCRADSVEAVRNMGTRLRKAMPDITLRTTCLVGFPGESEAHFEDLLAFVKETRFDHLGVFTYSPEEGTPAMALSGAVDPEVAEARRDRLLTAQREVVDRKAEALIDSADIVLLEKPIEDDHTVWEGRARRQAPDVDGKTIVSGVPADATPGILVPVRYVAAEDYDMIAEVSGVRDQGPGARS